MIARTLVTVLLIIGVLIAIVLILRNMNRTNSRINRIRRDYMVLYGLSKEQANQALDRHIALLKSKHPNREEIWYYEKALYDLQRDRR
ncbi:MAG: hypothetical protein GXZ09_05535 [Syntrophomonadaceae bacterium]|jgi:hypothetical protein|nr:hypothetical protein [Syntrophomonadaceae bacterium]